jgi:hypothetical protein
MPDITKCSGIGCPHKEKCYRYTSKPDPHWQSYFTEPPIKENEKCDCYWGEGGELIWGEEESDLEDT